MGVYLWTGEKFPLKSELVSGKQIVNMFEVIRKSLNKVNICYVLIFLCCGKFVHIFQVKSSLKKKGPTEPHRRINDMVNKGGTDVVVFFWYVEYENCLIKKVGSIWPCAVLMWCWGFWNENIVNTINLYMIN